MEWGRNIVRARGQGRVRQNSVLGSREDYCTHKLRAAVLLCTRPNLPTSQQDGRRESSLLAEERLTVDGW